MTAKTSSGSRSRQERLQRIGHSLLEMVRLMGERRDRTAREQNLHPTDLACIGRLHEMGRPISPKELIAHLGLTSGAGTALFDRLEKAGYVRRLPNPDDRRGVLIALDEKAAREPIAQMAKSQERYRAAMDSFSGEQLDVIGDFLERLTSISEDMDREQVESEARR